MTKPTIVSIVLVNLMLALPLGAQSNFDQQRMESGTSRYSGQRMESTQSQRSSGQRQNQTISVSGEVSTMRAINVRTSTGETRQHSLIQVQQSNGQLKAVDLGPVSNVNTLALRRGDFVQILGNQRTVNGRPVIVAQQVRHEGQTLLVSPFQPSSSRYVRSPLSRSSSQFQQSSQMRQPTRQSSQMRQTTRQSSQMRQTGRQSKAYDLNGQIDGFRHINLRNAMGQRDQHSLVKITLQNGRSAVVDLGPKRNLERIDLEKGKRIQVRGQRGTVDGRNVLLANQVRVGNETIRINRSPRPEQAGKVNLKGTVQGYQLTTIGTGTNQVALLRLRLLDGRSVLIDAGKKYTTGELDLRNLNLLDRVTIEGERQNRGGRQVIMANNIEFEAPASSGDRQFTREPQQRSRSNQGSRSSTGQSQGQSSSGQSQY